MMLFFGWWSYRIVTEGEKKEFWRLTVENASTVMKPDERDREQNIYKDVSSSLTPSANGGTGVRCFHLMAIFRLQLYTQHTDYLNSLVGQEFEMVGVFLNYESHTMRLNKSEDQKSLQI